MDASRVIEIRFLRIDFLRGTNTLQFAGVFGRFIRSSTYCLLALPATLGDHAPRVFLHGKLLKTPSWLAGMQVISQGKSEVVTMGDLVGFSKS
jgi:hypothetical protein